jgi:hypothetical protein
LPASPRYGSQVLDRDAGALAVGGGQRAQEPFDAAEVLADVLAQQLGRLRLQLDRRAPQVVVQPGLAVARGG